MATIAAILAAADLYTGLQMRKSDGNSLEGAVFSGRLGVVEIWDDGTVCLESAQKALYKDPVYLERLRSEALIALKSKL